MRGEEGGPTVRQIEEWWEACMEEEELESAYKAGWHDACEAICAELKAYADETEKQDGHSLTLIVAQASYARAKRIAQRWPE